MANSQKSYYAIIPANVRYDKKLPPNAKLLYGEITALTNEKNYCWAGNAYFAGLYQVNKNTISKWIGLLRDQGYIKVRLEYKEGTMQIVKRCIELSGEGITKKMNTPITKKGAENNTILNTTINNTIDEVIQFFREETGKVLNPKAKTHRGLISKALKNYTVQDLKDVVRFKNSEWKDSEKMKSFIRPSTLFRASNLDDYMIEVCTRRSKGKKLIVDNISKNTKIDVNAEWQN